MYRLNRIITTFDLMNLVTFLLLVYNYKKCHYRCVCVFFFFNVSGHSNDKFLTILQMLTHE